MWKNTFPICTPARKSLLWQDTRWVSPTSWKKKHLIRLKLLLLTIVWGFITYCINKKDVCADFSCTEPICVTFELGISKCPVTVGKPFLSLSGMKCCLHLFFTGGRELLIADSFIQKFWKPWTKKRRYANVPSWKIIGSQCWQKLTTLWK